MEIGSRIPALRLALLCGAAALTLTTAAPAWAAVGFSSHASAEQVYATGLPGGAKAKLLDRRGRVVAKRSANELGGVLFRNVEPGKGYRVRGPGGTGPKLRVFSNRPAPPDTGFYDQEVKSEGYGYMTMRDGTKLAYYSRPPDDVTKVFGYDIPEPPGGERPVLIEYAGYGYARPAGPQSGIATIANLMGFTVVNVNMRGTGCSGGAFDFFEPLQSLDGYDIIETVARQPWAADDKVGMMGISYGGISQLFVAATQPPHLAAIAPVSLIDQVQTTLFPGGILNTGFALEWAKQRIHDALPAGPDAGQGWAWERIQEGDEVCAENQVMHGEAVDLLRKIRSNKTYRAKVADPLSPVTFVDKINVPTFLACQWTDEQTGGHCPTLASRLTGTDRKWINFTNGTHVDALAPETYNRWYDFLNLYVAKQAPGNSPYLPVVQISAPLVFEEVFGISGLTLPPDPIQAQPTYESALAAFEALDPVRIMFDNGAGGDEPGHPYPGFEQSFSEFPVPGTQARTWFARSRGRLAGKRSKRRVVESFDADPHSTPPTFFAGEDTGAGDLWSALPSYLWEPHPDPNAVAFHTRKLKQDTVVIGSGFARAWIRAARRDVDLQVTVSEIRPDGKEVFVQGGWVRASMRKIDNRKSTRLEKVLSLRKRHVRPMPRDRFVKVTFPLYYEGHPYRAGSRIRIVISGVHGDQPIWAFKHAKPKQGSTGVEILSSAKRPTQLTLPVVPGIDVPTGLPPCPGLRGEPCRDFPAGP